MCEMSSRRRTHNSTWKTITVLDEDGNPERVFNLDERGRLIEGQIPRAKRRTLTVRPRGRSAHIRHAELVMPDLGEPRQPPAVAEGRVTKVAEGRISDVVSPDSIPINRDRAPPKLRAKIDDDNVYRLKPTIPNRDETPRLMLVPSQK